MRGRAPARERKAKAMAGKHDSYDDDFILGILKDTKVIAVVGASANFNRPSYFAMRYLQQRGYRVIPVNPREAQKGTEILGEKCYASLSEIPVKVDMVDCFRTAADIPPIADEAIKIGAKYLWLQLGVRDDKSAAKAELAGLKVVMNRCPKIEHGRLSRSIAFMGVNTGFISSKRKTRI